MPESKRAAREAGWGFGGAPFPDPEMEFLGEGSLELGFDRLVADVVAFLGEGSLELDLGRFALALALTLVLVLALL